MRKEKQFLLDQIQENIAGAKGIVIMRYKGLTANAANQFRAGAEKVGGQVAMVPKRVLIKGAKQAGLDLDKGVLDGHIGLVFAEDDALEVTKYVIGFGQASEQVVEVIGGRVEGKLYDGADMDKLSKLPGINEMRAQFLGTLEAPLSQTLATVEAILTSVLHCLENKSQALGEGSSCGEGKCQASDEASDSQQ